MQLMVFMLPCYSARAKVSALAVNNAENVVAGPTDEQKTMKSVVFHFAHIVSSTTVSVSQMKSLNFVLNSAFLKIFVI